MEQIRIFQVVLVSQGTAMHLWYDAGNFGWDAMCGLDCVLAVISLSLTYTIMSTGSTVGSGNNGWPCGHNHSHCHIQQKVVKWQS